MERIRESLQVRKERAILVAALLRGRESDNLQELSSLVESAGAVVVDRFQQKIRAIKASTYIGKGKAEELAERVTRFQADVVIFDNDLSPGQIRELEKVIEAKILDRSELILDIFASRAKTRQARLQVELAQLEYTYPRLTRMWSHLDTLAGAGGGTAAGAVGGIGTRGPGEQQLEIDRRLVNKRLTELKRELSLIDKRRMREINGRGSMFKICLIGYTNAGKSTLLNALTNSGAFVEDRLFATLDTKTKKWVLARASEVLLSDTVGFVKNLPHQLVASFKATLEEAVNADLLLHVVDASNAEVLKQIDVVNEVLAEIGCEKKPVLHVLNKVDAVRDITILQMLQTIYPDATCISAKKGVGLDELTEVVLGEFKGTTITIKIVFLQSNGKSQSFLRAHGKIVKQEYQDDSIIIEAQIGQKQLSALRGLKYQKLEILDE